MTKAFPASQQPIDSATCGPYCLQNIYESLGMNIQVKEILKDIYRNEKDITYLEELARHLNNNKLETTLFTANSYIFSPGWKKMAKSQVIDELKNWITANVDGPMLHDALHALFYLQEGGRLEVGNLSVELFDKLITTDHLLLCLIEESWLWEKRKIAKKPEYDNIRGNARGHYVVVYGIDEGKYLVSDPYPTKIKGKEKNYMVDKNQLLNAVFLRGASIVAIKNPKSKTK